LHRLRGDDSGEFELLLSEIRAVISRRETAPAVLETLRPPAYGPVWRHTLAARVLNELALRPECVVPRIEFASYVLDSRALAQLFVTIQEARLLHVDAQRAAFGAIDRSTAPGIVEELLRSERPEKLRRLALHALVARAHARGWSREQRALLASYRADPSMLVSSAASWVFPPPLPAKR
ncbi:MAG TPA: hypothetical protein VFQ35_21950, partial [Polyangiaceae bacterium]|nr:hypothetical protein [Polyangiaceae bacterium]